MNSTTILILVATVAVIALTLIPTYIISGRKKTTQADWEVADRSLPLYVVIGTQFASAMGGGILVAHVGNAYARGIGHFIYGVLASLPFIIIMVLAKWLRRNNFTTIPDVLAHFTNGNKLIRICAGVCHAVRSEDRRMDGLHLLLLHDRHVHRLRCVRHGHGRRRLQYRQQPQHDRPVHAQLLELHHR